MPQSATFQGVGELHILSIMCNSRWLPNLVVVGDGRSGLELDLDSYENKRVVTCA